MNMLDMVFNKYQSSLDELNIYNEPQEIQDQFFDFINNVPYIRNLISKNRPRACELPRDEKGKIFIDLTNPHILEDMDYFRPTAIHFQKTGRISDLRPNPNPNSEYGKWIREEVRRCDEGYIRESDGEWITGDYYFFLNYCPILLSKLVGGKKALRVWDFPEVWEGHYLKFHYIKKARDNGKHGAELASRSKGKSFSLAAMIAKRFLLGETKDVKKEVKCLVTAYQKEYLTKDGILNKFQSYIDFCAQNTQFPARRLRSSLQDMNWKMGYVDLDTNTQKGTLNEVIGVSSKDDESKLRGKRGVLIAIEEFGSFPNLLGLYGTLRPSVEEGDAVYGLIYMQGTAGDDESDFASAQEIMYNPIGYNMQELNNLYDKEGQGRKYFVYFFPGYLNRKGCYNSNGVSDVTKALLEILKNRYTVKYNSTDLKSITKTISEVPITPQEAILRSQGNIFPVTALNERLNQLDNNPNSYDDSYIGELIQNKEGKIEFRPTNDIPIREFPLKDNKAEGALEIFEMPQEIHGKIPQDRYIMSLDNYENDVSNTMSLGSMFVLDLWTDRIVAEYTGRPMFSDDLNELARKLAMFYNARILYEAHPYTQKVLTPEGEKLWKDIKIGDTLFAPNGKTVNVIDIPVDCKMPIYKITLLDGRVIEASDNHIWEVIKLNSPSKTYLTTTKEMYNSGVFNKHGQHKYFIRNAGKVEYKTQNVPIDAYTMGLLLAEGCFSSNRSICNNKRVQLSACEKDKLFYETVIPYKITYKSKHNWNLFIENIKNTFINLGLYNKLSHDKFIPSIYLYNDYDNRLELLKGLMDGDGCATSKGAKIYTTVSEQLSKDIMKLCRSLGINCKSKYVKNIIKGKEVYHYRISIFTDEIIFKLPRKINKCHKYQFKTKGSKANSYINKIAIESIEFKGYEQGKCVTVNSEDGLYLIGDYVITHNCNKKNTFAYFSKMNCLYLLADTPEYLKNKQLIKTIGYGNVSKGVSATVPIKNYGFTLIRDWLLKPVVSTQLLDGEEIEITVPNLYHLKNRALIKELILFNPDINVDRIMSLLQLMLFREEKMVLYNGNPSKSKDYTPKDYLGNDPFFNRVKI